MERAFGYTLPEYLYFGGYPGAAPCGKSPRGSLATSKTPF